VVTAIDRTRFIAAVQTNCHIADARHATDMTLCTYLLQMREFFRWELGLAFGAALAQAELGAWIAEREALWASLEERELAPLPCTPYGRGLDPYDVTTINRHLAPLGLLYGAGLVGADRPVFFVADLHTLSRRVGLDVLTAGREYARTVVAPPAALAGSGAGEAIVLRREAMARWCWEKWEAFTARPHPGTAFHAFALAYGLERGFEAALPRWLDEQGETLVLHELGEHRAGRMLGTGWAAMRLALPGRRADLHARAVRDHLADLGVTLPTLLARGAGASIHFWFANYDGVREVLFPSLKAAYVQWRQGDDGRALRQAMAQGATHFARLAQQALDLHARDGDLAGAAIERLLTAPEAVCPGKTEAQPRRPELG
jgi:hypothetical protein